MTNKRLAEQRRHYGDSLFSCYLDKVYFVLGWHYCAGAKDNVWYKFSCMRLYTTQITSWLHPWRHTHQSVRLNVGGQGVDPVAQALIHDVHIAAELPAVVGLAHVAAVVVPAGALLGQLEERLVSWRDQQLWETETDAVTKRFHRLHVTFPSYWGIFNSFFK